jgi:rhamnose transport system substrate-binding protein
MSQNQTSTRRLARTFGWEAILVATSPYKGKVVLTGLGTPSQLREFVKDGTIKEFELWNPADVGYLAAYAAARLCSGNIEGKEGEIFSAGKLGSRTVGKDGVVLLGPPTVFTAANIDKFNFWQNSFGDPAFAVPSTPIQ